MPVTPGAAPNTAGPERPHTRTLSRLPFQGLLPPLPTSVPHAQIRWSPLPWPVHGPLPLPSVPASSDPPLPTEAAAQTPLAAASQSCAPVTLSGHPVGSSRTLEASLCWALRISPTCSSVLEGLMHLGRGCPMPASCHPLGCRSLSLPLVPPPWTVHRSAHAWSSARPSKAREGLTLNL